MAAIAFLGLGNMGGPMAKNLLAAGHSLTGFDLVEAACAALEAEGAAIAASAAAAAEGAFPRYHPPLGRRPLLCARSWSMLFMAVYGCEPRPSTAREAHCESSTLEAW